MKVVFRVDSGSSIGGGHLMRCLSLAELMIDLGLNVCFICRELPGSLIPVLQKKDIPLVILPELKIGRSPIKPDNFILSDALQTQNALEAQIGVSHEYPDWLIVDHYGLDASWEKALRPFCKRLMVIDDLANRNHDCDVLLDQNFYVDPPKGYDELVPRHCKTLLGPKYAILRKEFEVLRERRSICSGELKRILIFFTLGDDQGETIKAMKGLLFVAQGMLIDVVIGRANPHILDIKEICKTQRWGYHCQIDYMPELIAQADLIIGSGGSSHWERCALGVPTLVTILAENQIDATQALESAGAVVNLGWGTTMDSKDYAATVIACTAQQLIALSNKASMIVDAKGAQRVIKTLMTNSTC
jgi:UDP-2,4-diacetamido-2,4,6-trideoxy-beta-L-altropyranose hydrolase